MDTINCLQNLINDLKPHLFKLDLNGFSGLEIVENPVTEAAAQVVKGKIEINRLYISKKVEQILQGDMVAYSDLLNAIHHEACHIDIDNRMPFLLQKIEDKDLFPMGIACRFIKEFFACANSSETMSIECLQIQLTKDVEVINQRLVGRDIKSYCNIVCDLAYLIGNCFHKPCGYFSYLCSAIEEEKIVEMVRLFQSEMENLEKTFPLKGWADLNRINEIIMFGWSWYGTTGGEKDDI